MFRSWIIFVPGIRLLDRRRHADPGDVFAAIHGRHSATAQDALEFVLTYLFTHITASLAVVAIAAGQVSAALGAVAL